MSICADTLRILLSAGMGNNEAIKVAEAMERGPDRDIIYTLIENMRAVNCPSEAIGIAVYEVALEIERANRRPPVFRVVDEHTSARDSNRSRRGMSDAKWRALRKVIFKRDGYVCLYCDAADDLTCDHIVPLARGGTNDHDNLATACRSCNSSKGDKLLEEWPRYGN